MDTAKAESTELAEAKAELFGWKSLFTLKGAAIAATSTALLFGGGGLAASNTLANSNEVVNGVKAEGRDISGLTAASTQRLFDDIAASKTKPLNFTYGDQTFTIQPDEIAFTPNTDAATRQAIGYGRGGSMMDNFNDQLRTALNGRNVVLTANYDEALLNERLQDIAWQIDRQPENAYCYFDDNGNIAKVNGVVGKHLDTDAIAASLKTPLTTLDIPNNIELTPEDIIPFVSTEDISAIDSVIGQYSTSYNPGDRGDNIAIAAYALNDRIVKTGWVFSFNDTVGERTYSAGYKDAGVIINGRPEQDVGGGVCQVSSTLYNAVLLAGLTPTVRTAHFFPSSYVAPGRDATVADGQIDFQFRNDLPHNVYLLSSAWGSTLTVYVLGTQADLGGAKIAIEREGDSMRPSVYRVFYKDGQVIKEEFLHTDSYSDPVTD